MQREEPRSLSTMKIMNHLQPRLARLALVSPLCDHKKDTHGDLLHRTSTFKYTIYDSKGDYLGCKVDVETFANKVI